MMKVSAVIPTYKGLSLLKKNLPAVLKCLRNGDELVVVDDASTDQTANWLKEEFAAKFTILPEPKLQDTHSYLGQYQTKTRKIRIHILVNDFNQRFAESCNHGVIAAKNPVVLLLNNDVLPQPGLVEKLLSYFEADGSVFAVGCLELEPTKKDEWVKGGKNQLWFERGMFIHSRASEFSSGPTAWVSGGSGMFDRGKWLALNGFDRAFYPAYWEDVDLSFRARKKGWRVLFSAEAVVEHHHESTNKDVFGKQQMNKISWRNAKKFVWKNGDIWQKIAFILWKPYWWLKGQI